jgi:hypothetical protein
MWDGIVLAKSDERKAPLERTSRYPVAAALPATPKQSEGGWGGVVWASKLFPRFAQRSGYRALGQHNFNCRLYRPFSSSLSACAAPD